MKDHLERGRPDPYLLTGGPVGCLVIHGFTGSPAEMHLIAKHLHGQGHTIHAPLLAGHGTCPEDMERTGWRDWVASAEAGYRLLAGMTRTVYVIGLSMGGLLALHIAATRPVQGVVSMCAPIYVKKRAVLLAPLLQHFSRFTAKSAPSEKFRDDLWSYDRTPTACVPHLLALIRRVRRELPSITAPALVVQGERDNTVDPKSADFILKHLGSREKRLVMLRNSGHLVTLDQDLPDLLSAIDTFLAATS
ncbi:MAG: alpha/beta fold hydrolase [Bacillota bacterium]